MYVCIFFLYNNLVSYVSGVLAVTDISVAPVFVSPVKAATNKTVPITSIEAVLYIKKNMSYITFLGLLSYYLQIRNNVIIWVKAKFPKR